MISKKSIRATQLTIAARKHFSTLRIMKGSHHRYRKLRRGCALLHG